MKKNVPLSKKFACMALLTATTLLSTFSSHANDKSAAPAGDYYTATIAVWGPNGYTWQVIDTMSLSSCRDLVELNLIAHSIPHFSGGVFSHHPAYVVSGCKLGR